MSNDYTNAEYEKDVTEYAESILSETIADNPEADADEVREAVQERLHETIDGSQNVIYTWRAQLVCAYSANDGYTASNFGAESLVDDCGNLDWSVIAYGAMYADVSEELWPLFDEWERAHGVAQDVLADFHTYRTESVEDLPHALQEALAGAPRTQEAGDPILFGWLVEREVRTFDEVDEARTIQEAARLYLAWLVEEAGPLVASGAHPVLLRVEREELVALFEGRGFSMETFAHPACGFYQKAHEGDELADIFAASGEAPALSVDCLGPFYTVADALESGAEFAASGEALDAARREAGVSA